MAGNQRGNTGGMVTPLGAVDVARRDNGELILTNPRSPAPMARSIAHLLLERAREYPDRTVIAERDGDGWKHLTYRDAVAGARCVAQWLIDNGADESRPLAILSGASINHFLMAWGAILARVPYVPVSQSYSTVPGAYPKLEAVLQRVGPAFIFAESFAPHLPALDSIDFDRSNVQLIAVEQGPADCVPFAVVSTAEPTAEVDASTDRIDHDTVTRYMFTSGSTGMPKGVLVNHRMSCFMLASAEGLRDSPETAIETRVLDWMPWSHVGAGVMRLASVINAAGTIFLDTGKPVPGEFHKTIENISTAKPTSFAGAPLGWSMLVDALEKDEELARGFYENVRAMQSGSAAMPASLAERIQALNVRYTGHRFPLGTSLASTEVHGCLSKYWPSERNDIIGLPTPGAEIKLIPFGDKYELRVRSAGVTPGYLNDEAKTRESFDDEGFFKMGDAVRFADPERPEEGLVFAGRVAEEFKLITGTWVSAGTLRAEAVAAASPYVRDVVVGGINENFVALLVWPNLSACEALADSSDPASVAASDAVKDRIREGFCRYNEKNTGSSKYVRRFLLLAEPPDPGGFEITDKGYINQGAVLSRRDEDVGRLFADAPDSGVVDLSEGEQK